MEDLKPAAEKSKIDYNLSSQEFKNILSSWLEEKGFISEIRSEIRYKIFHSLKNTTLGQGIFRKVSENKKLTLSKQALNMVVAEYLLQNYYEYSVSVFSMESSLTNFFKHCSFQQINEDSSNISLFDESTFFDMLDLMNIPKNSQTAKNLFKTYYQQSYCGSLLSCIIHHLGVTNTYCEKSLYKKNYVGATNDVDWIKETVSFLTHYSIPPEDIQYLINRLRASHSSEIQHVHSKNLQQIKEYRKEIENKQHIIDNLSKTNNELESQLEKLSKANNKLETQLLKTKEYEEKKSNIDLVCDSPSCQKIHQTNTDTIEHLKSENMAFTKEISDLNDAYQKQQKMYKALTKKFINLTKAFNDCQNKIFVISAKVNEGNDGLSNKIIRKISS